MKFTYNLLFILAGIFIVPLSLMADGGPIKVKGSSSASTVDPICLALSEYSFVLYLHKNSNAVSEISMLDVEFPTNIVNEISSIELIEESNNVSLPYALNDFLKIKCNTTQNLINSHYSLGLDVDVLLTLGYTYKGTYSETEQWEEANTCSVSATTIVNKGGICALQDSRFLEFDMTNETADFAEFTGFEGSLEEGVENAIIRITLHDAEGEEELSLPFELLMHEKMKLIVELENTLAPTDDIESFSISINFNFHVEEGSYDEMRIFTYDFSECKKSRTSTLRVFPNPVSENTIVSFEVLQKNSLVSAYLIPKFPGKFKRIILVDKETYPEGEHHLKLPIRKMVDGLYELFIAIDDEISTKSLILPRE